MNFDFLFINKLLIAIINMVGIWLAFWVYFSDRKKPLNRGFIFFVILNIIWIDFFNLSFFANQDYLSLLYARLVYASAAIFFIFFYYLFIIWFLNEKGWYVFLGKLIIIYEILIAFSSIFTNYIIKDVKLGKWSIIPIYATVGAYIYHIIIVILTILITGRLLIRYFKFPKETKIKIQYFLLGILIFVSANLFFAVILPFFFGITNYFSLANYSTIFLLSFTAYAIVKQKLFDIKVVFTGLFVGLTAILLATDAFIFTHNDTMRIFKIIIMAGFLLFGYYLIRNVKNEMERREKLEKLTKLLEIKTSDLSALLDISQVIAIKETNMNKITQKVLDAIPEKLGTQGFLTGFLGLYDENKQQLYAYATTQNLLMKKAVALLSKAEQPYESYSIPISVDTLMTKAFKTKQITVSGKFSDCISPPASKKMANILQSFTGMNSAMIVPIIIHDKTIGILGFTLKQSVEEIDDRIKNLATAFTNHLAITLENAKYLEDTHANSQDITALFKLSQLSATSIQMEKVAQTMLDNIPIIFGYLGYLAGILTLYDENTGKIKAYVTTQSELIKRAGKFLAKDWRHYDGGKNLIIQAIISKKIQTSTKLEDFFREVVPEKICQTIQKNAKIKSVAAVPIISFGKVRGVVTFLSSKTLAQISNKSLVEINERDKKIMLSFANQLGIAIENTQLYEEVSKNVEKLKSMNRELKELAEVKSTFLSIASHQLRTPVSIAKGMLSMLVEGKIPPEEKDRFIKRSFLGVERLSVIIHDLLSASAMDGKKYKLNKSEIQIDDLIKQAINERMIKIEENSKVKLIYHQPTKPTPLIIVDQNKIREVVGNLIDNSIQYTIKGQIDIVTKIVKNVFIFTITDTGIGFSPTDRSKLFKKISRLPNAMALRSDGTGLGLFLAHQIIKSHGGKVDAKSTGLNQGSVFSFQIPIK